MDKLINKTKLRLKLTHKHFKWRSKIGS